MKPTDVIARLRVKFLEVANTVNITGLVKIAGTTMLSTAQELNELHNVGVVAADFSKLVALTPTAAKLNNFVGGAAGSYVLARGQATTVAASDDINTGLSTVVAVIAQLDDDPVDGCMHVSCSIGDQAGAPAAGHFLLKTWKSTDADATLIAATTFGKKVNWVAIGTLA